MASGILRENVVGFLDGSGNLTLKIGPVTAREKWSNVIAHVSANQNATNEAVCTISYGDSVTRKFIDATSSGSFGDTTGKIPDVIKKGDYVWAQWTGGDSGQQATLMVTGTKEV